MKKLKVSLIGCAALAMVILFACGKGNEDDNNGNPTGNDAFKKAMLENYADNIIIPAYNNLNTRLTELETVVQAFMSDPSTTTQNALKEPFKAVYIGFENVSVVYLGPAASLLLNNYMNTFPSAVARIEAGISSGEYNFNQPVTSDSIQGLPALDYLLFSPNAVSDFTENNQSARIQYVSDVIARMKTLVNNTLSQWNGAYRASFVNSLKTDVGSSIGFLINQFAYEMDALKGPRIGWPFGKQSNGIVFVDKCEGYYSGISKELAVANLTSLKNYFTGGARDGISEYLILLKKEQLNNDVLAQFDITLSAINDIPAPLSQSFTANAPKVEEAYKQIQKLLTLIKTDVASATAVQITYMDNDGD